jgi:hypothetical protein
MSILGRMLRVAVTAATLVSASSGVAPAQSASGVVPKNYVQLIAAKLRQMENPSVVEYAGITKPRERFVGLFYGGSRIAVCARVVRPNFFGASAAWYYMFYFENGRVEGFKQAPTGAIQQALVRCEEPLTPITHLVRSRR